MKKKKIMIVDDNRPLLEELESALLSEDYDTSAVDDASSVVMTAEKLRPDIILLDMKMSGKSGFQIADDLKHFSATADIPIIAMTGHFMEKQHINFMKSLGISDCILKPFDTHALISKIREHTEAAEAPPRGDDCF
jgi:DNA-binding response OmpR family regulator